LGSVPIIPLCKSGGCPKKKVIPHFLFSDTSLEHII
jgi:hypothetical protein